jgi:hypothetical protein
MIEDPEPQLEKKSNVQPVIAGTGPKRSLGSLDAIRKKVTAQNKMNGTDARELTAEELRLAWDQFIEKLADKKNHSAVTNFKMASLRIIDDNSIEIITGNNIQQKFIEQERVWITCRTISATGSSPIMLSSMKKKIQVSRPKNL